MTRELRGQPSRDFSREIVLKYEGLDGRGGGGGGGGVYKCQLSVEILAICQLLVKF